MSAGLALMGGCATTPVKWTWAGSGDDVILTYGYSNGWAYARGGDSWIPALTLTRDGHLYLSGEPDSPKSLIPVYDTTLTPTQVDSLLDQAASSDLLDHPSAGRPDRVMDAPSDALRFVTTGGEVKVDVYAPMPEFDHVPGVTADQARTRAAARDFVAALHALAPGGSPAAFAPTGHEFVPRQIVVSRIVDVPAAAGETSYPAHRWPIDGAVPSPPGAGHPRTCLILDGAAADELRHELAHADRRSQWLIPGEKHPATLVFRPVIPGDPGCRPD